MEVNDIGEKAQLEEGDLQDKGIVRKVVTGDIVGVNFCDEYEVCNGEVNTTDDDFGEKEPSVRLQKQLVRLSQIRRKSLCAHAVQRCLGQHHRRGSERRKACSFEYQHTQV